MTLMLPQHHLDKRKQAQAIMKEKGIPVWLVWVADNGAEVATLPLIGAPHGASNIAYVLTPTSATALCGHIEASKQKEYGFDVVETKSREVFEPLIEFLLSVKGVKTGPFALNYSDRFAAIDTLGFGTASKLMKRLVESSVVSSSAVFTSADELIVSVASRKLPFEIELLKEAAQITDDVIRRSFTKFRAGMTEKDIAHVMHSLAEERMSKDKRLGWSWHKEFNPIVLTGEGIAHSPHAAPSDRVVERGSTVYVDFGISVNGYGGDLQQVGYVLRKDEVRPPAPVHRMYELLLKSVDAGCKAARPGAKGWEVDKASRDVILAAGYPSFQHGTGHQLGAGNVHSPGVAFTTRYSNLTNDEKNGGKENPYSQLTLEEGFVMTIEPRIQIKNGVSIELDGVVTKKGYLPFTSIPPLHVIK